MSVKKLIVTCRLPSTLITSWDRSTPSVFLSELQYMRAKKVLKHVQEYIEQKEIAAVCGDDISLTPTPSPFPTHRWEDEVNSAAGTGPSTPKNRDVCRETPSPFPTRCWEDKVNSAAGTGPNTPKNRDVR
jgi:hypothetical protein